MFVDLDWPLNASSLLSASAELLVMCSFGLLVFRVFLCYFMYLLVSMCVWHVLNKLNSTQLNSTQQLENGKAQQAENWQKIGPRYGWPWPHLEVERSKVSRPINAQTGDVPRAGKNSVFNSFFKGFLMIFFSFYLTNAGHKITTQKQRFGHINAANRNSYLNIICIKLCTQVKKITKNLKFRVGLLT